MGDKALRGNRLTAQGGGRIAGPARRAQESGFYSPDMGMRGKFGYKHGKRAGYAIGSIIKGAKKIISKVIKPKGVTDKPFKYDKSYTKADDEKIQSMLTKLGDEIKAQPLPPQLKKLMPKLKKAFPHKKAEGGRAGYAIGGAAAKVPKIVKEYFKKKKKKKLAEDTKKGKFPETESLTHQKGPYVGDVGSERPGVKRKGWEKPDWLKRPERPGPKRPEWTRPLGVGGRERVGQAKGGKTDKKWIQKAVDPKHKGFCTPMTKKTCTPRRKALARTFKKMGRERKAKG
jgi:hypothetical protein